MKPDPTITPDELAKLNWMRASVTTGVERSIRRALGRSQREVSRKSRLSRWESGKRVPRGDHALRHADLLTRFMNRVG